MKLLARIFAFTLLVGLGQAAAQSYTTQQFKRQSYSGNGKREAPLGTIRYQPGLSDGDTIVIFANGFDPDGDNVYIDYYVNGRLFTSQSEPPYAAQIGSDIYGNLPTKVTVVVRDNFGNASRADIAITSTAFSTSYTCSYTLSSSEDPVSATGSSVVPTQSGNTGLALSFSNNNTLGSGESVKVTAALTLSGTSASGNLSIVRNSTSDLIAVTGSVTYADDGVTVESFSVSDSASSSTLSCS